MNLTELSQDLDLRGLGLLVEVQAHAVERSSGKLWPERCEGRHVEELYYDPS